MIKNSKFIHYSTYMQRYFINSLSFQEFPTFKNFAHVSENVGRKEAPFHKQTKCVTIAKRRKSLRLFVLRLFYNSEVSLLYKL